MTTNVLTLAGAGLTNSTTNSAAAIDIPEDGFLMGVGCVLLNETNYTPVTIEAEVIKAQLNFVSTAQFLSNDSRGVIASIVAMSLFLTTGGSHLFANLYVQLGDGIKVAGGERIFAHTLATAGPVPGFEFQVMFSSGKTVTRRSARRR